MYTEERQEDQEELHERTVGQARGECVPFLLSRPSLMTDPYLRSTSTVPLPELIRLAQEHQETYPKLISTVKKFLHVFERDIDDGFRADLFVVLESFIDHASHLEDFDQGWRTFIVQYLSSVQHLVGQQSVIRSSRVADTNSVPTSFLDELEGLRAKVDELSEERTTLRAELNEQIAETNTLRALPVERSPEPGDKVRLLPVSSSTG